jgi:hypothetical protein
MLTFAITAYTDRPGPVTAEKLVCRPKWRALGRFPGPPGNSTPRLACATQAPIPERVPVSPGNALQPWQRLTRRARQRQWPGLQAARYAACSAAGVVRRTPSAAWPPSAAPDRRSRRSGSSRRRRADRAAPPPRSLATASSRERMPRLREAFRDSVSSPYAGNGCPQWGQRLRSRAPLRHGHGPRRSRSARCADPPATATGPARWPSLRVVVPGTRDRRVRRESAVGAGRAA